MLGVLSVTAYLFVARSTLELLQPLLALPEGRGAYDATMHRVAVAIGLFDLPLVIVVGVASYALAALSIRPLLAAREREARFAADAAHELRTPLATIAGIAQAARDADPPRQAAALVKIVDQALEASRLVGDLLLLMREEKQSTRLHEPVDVAALARAVVGELRARNGAVAIDLDVPADGAYVVGDERALRRLVANVVENAQRHARGRIDVSVANGGAEVTLAVEDDGEGVPAEARERIFERFFKIRPDGPGSGLGLAICRRIARAHGGEIALDGRARFVTRLPQAVWKE